MSQKFFESGPEASKKFLDSMHNDRHILLLYEDFRKGLEIQFEYLKKGLEQNECCVFAMPYEINIKQKMIDSGIDVEKYQKENLLFIIPVNYRNQKLTPEKMFKSFLNKILSKTKNKIRICAVLDFDLSTTEGMQVCITAETLAHSSFESFNGSWVCSYDISKIKEEERISWIKKLINNHHSVIIAPLDESGISFDVT